MAKLPAEIGAGARAAGVTMVYGVDGCRAGWFAAAGCLETGEYSWGVFTRMEEILVHSPAPVVAAVDIPIGLPENGPRACDLAARLLLGPGRAASVFPAPIRPVLAAAGYRAACEIRQAVEGKRMSRQAWLIVGRIREVDDLLRQTPQLQSRVREVHPELCFWQLAGGRPMRFGKKRREGLEERLALLQPHFGLAVQQALMERRQALSSVDDVLDAFAALWTAERIARGEALRLPAAPPIDRCGLPMEIVM